jgi:hypothetical protein
MGNANILLESGPENSKRIVPAVLLAVEPHRAQQLPHAGDVRRRVVLPRLQRQDLSVEALHLSQYKIHIKKHFPKVCTRVL